MSREKYLGVEKVALKPVKRAFELKGFKVLFLKQIWRHVHGKLRKNKTEYFLKLSSTTHVARNTKNEVSWNQQLNPLLKSKKSVKVPRIHETGTLGGRFYYLSDFCVGKPLATRSRRSFKHLRDSLDRIVNLNLYFLKLRGASFKLDTLRDNANVALGFVKVVRKRYEDIAQYGFEDLLKKVESLRGRYTPSVNHGDFVPWHFIRGNGELYLIDGEHASSLLPKYYDVSYFYERVYARGRAPRLAREYLGKLWKSLPEKEQEYFEKEFVPVLASRAITGMRDLIVLDKSTKTQYYERLKEDILKHKFF